MKLMTDVKTIFSYKKVTLLLFISVAILMLISIGTVKEAPIFFDCSSELHINKDENGKLKSVVRVFFHFSQSGRGVIKEYGDLKYNNESYGVNRTVYVDVIHEGGGFYEIKKKTTIVNNGDNLPDSLYNMLVSKDTLLLYNIKKIDDNLIIIRNNKRTIFVCAINKNKKF